MALVRFFKNKESAYTTEVSVNGMTYPWDITKYNDAVFFATDTRSIWLNGIRYRISPELESKLSKGRLIDTINGVSSQGVINFWFLGETSPLPLDLRDILGLVTDSTSGLMGPSHLSSLKNLSGSVEAIIEEVSKIKDSISKAMHFIGVLPYVPIFVVTEIQFGWSSDGVSIDSNLHFEAGDVILVGEKEYVCNRDNVFVEFGDTNDFVTSDKFEILEGQVNENTAKLADHEIRITSVEKSLTWENRYS